jgi:hypothetical protein
MARSKKTAKKATTKKPTPKAKKQTAEKKERLEAAKQFAARKTDSKKEQNAIIKMLMNNKTASGPIKRPPNNPDMPQNVIDNLNTDFNSIKEVLDNFSQHLRSLDRRRLNGVGVRKLGFIERAYEFALENAEFLPHYLTLDRFGKDIQYFMDFRTLVDLVTQIREKLWNITIQSSDIAYTDALEFYASVREAAKRRVDAAETIHNALSAFFKSHGRRIGEEPTEKEELRDFKALQHGKHDGILVIENKKPKLTGGKHKVIDETLKDSAKFKGDIEGDVSE